MTRGGNYLTPRLGYVPMGSSPVRAKVQARMFLTKFDATQPWRSLLAAERFAHHSFVNLDPGLPDRDAPHEMANRDQVLMVLEGEILAEVAEEKARMLPGTAVVIPAGVAHRILNGGRMAARTVTLTRAPELNQSYC